MTINNLNLLLNFKLISFENINLNGRILTRILIILDIKNCSALFYSFQTNIGKKFKAFYFNSTKKCFQNLQKFDLN
jgi:hypothetical protein